MDISSMKEAVQALYRVQDGETVKAADGKDTASFGTYMREAMEKGQLVFPEGGDVVMSHPPLYATKYKVDMDKPTDEMTLDEYKQYICNVVSALPVSASMKTCSSGTLIFKEEAFGGMKNDPGYEKEVIDMLREKYAGEVPACMPNVSYQVIGSSMDKCYGSSIPLKNYSLLLGLGGLGGLGSSLLGLGGLGGLGSSLLGLGGLGGLDSSLLGLGGLGSSLLGLGVAGTGLGGSMPLYGTAYANMAVNAYKKIAAGKNGNVSTREYRGRWRERI